MTCETTKPDTFASPLLQGIFLLEALFAALILETLPRNLAAKSVSQFCYVWLHHPAAQPEMLNVLYLTGASSVAV